MRIFRHYNDVPDAYKGAVVALGNFDGVHRGHQALIGEAKRLAVERGAPLGVIAFEPHPQEFFRPGGQNFRLTPFRTKARLIAEQGADVMYALGFDAEMAKKSAQEFVIDVLVEGLGVGHVVVGADFQFGKGRAGNTSVLAYMGEMEGFGLTVFEPVTAGTAKISSTEIRNALKAGKPEEAARLLGHWWTIESHVIPGDKRGRTIGFPTVNMKLEGCMEPAYGIYAVRASVVENETVIAKYDGVASYGVRPMFEVSQPLLETYLFDFSGDLYGRHLAVELIAYLRPEMKLPDLAALKARIGRDCEDARAALAKAGQMPPPLDPERVR
ncbi:MAG TPA: bifunctional riboflavin kinase/FAD synthetase [Rhizomicrobium sp.]|nr:bifunctional riboflavin kinase/FAD synthetase [Rhizomicrobium sp.]